MQPRPQRAAAARPCRSRSGSRARPARRRGSRARLERRVDEAVGDGLGVAARREQVRDVVRLDDVLARRRRAARRLRPASPESRRSRTCGRPPRSGLPRSRCRSGTPAASRASRRRPLCACISSRSKMLGDLLRRHVDAEHRAQPLRAAARRPDARASRRRARRSRPGPAFAAADREQQLASRARSRAPAPWGRRRARSAATRRCAGRAGARARDRRGREERALEEHGVRRGAHGRRLAAHDAGQARPGRARRRSRACRRASSTSRPSSSVSFSPARASRASMRPSSLARS